MTYTFSDYEAMMRTVASRFCRGTRHEAFVSNCPVCLARYQRLHALIYGPEALLKERAMAGVPTIFHPVQNDGRLQALPEPVVLRAYEVYAHLYGAQPALLDVAKGCRGGFGVGELLAFLYARTFPKDEWRVRFEEALERLRTS